MFPALLATLLWSTCVITARRSVEQLGENQANIARLLVAVVAMGFIAHAFGTGIGGGALWLFFLSGVIGFGIGDIGIFYALPRIGSRLTLLLAQCLAVPIAGFTEWLWLGTVLTPSQLGAVVVIVVGISMALIPKHMPAESWPMFWVGIAFGVLAALGQAFGAVLSRKAFITMDTLGSGAQLDHSVWQSILLGATSGYQRLLGGILALLAFYVVTLVYRKWYTLPREARKGDSASSKTLYVVLTAASGPILGIICYQWALATTPSAIVQPIVAMTPLVVMPLAYLIEGDRPRKRALVGTFISVLGVLWLAMA